MECYNQIFCIKHLFYVNLVILRTVLCSQGQLISIYNDYNFKGVERNVNISICTSLPFTLVGSIKTHGNCARLYIETSCMGNFMEISKKSPFTHVLRAWDNFIIDVQSAGPCPKACLKETTRLSPKDSTMININEEAYYNGTSHNINVSGCTRIADELVNKTTSIITNGHCVKLYKNKDCISDGHEIELGEGTALYGDLHYYWNFKTTKSISHCNFACPRGGRTVPNSRKGEIFVYEKSSFLGRMFVISNINGNCKDVPKDMAGLTNSIQISDNICVILFDQNGCMGDSYILNITIADLSEWKQNVSIKSVKECLQIETTTAAITNTTPESNSSSSQKTIPNEHEYIKESSISLVHVVVIGLVSVVGLLSLLFVARFVKTKCNSSRKETGRISEKEIREFFNGCGNDMTASSNSSVENLDERSTEFKAQNRPYNKKYDVSCSRIEYDLEKPVLKEDLGILYKGTLKPITKEPNTPVEGDGKTVTIKTANPSSGLHGLQSILKEVKVMLYLGKHTNIAHLVGCCTENLSQGKIFVLMEFCGGGTLDAYLRNNRQSFSNLVTKGRLSIDCDIESRVKSIYLPNMTAKPREQLSFDTFLIVQWCIDVSSGMEFLSNAKIVHSDLAAKNILLTDKLHAKISDYGLSRQMYSRARYLKTQHEPWRWMAPESIKRLEFSIKSDMWSYGVLCWEIFTLGDKPYHGIRLKEQFLYNIEEGLRLTKPRNATNEFYNLMLRCWEDEPQDRPSFTEMSNEIQEMLEALINWMPN